MDGRAALITGAGSGIGADLASALARRGVKLTLADVDVAAAERVAAAVRAAGGQAVAVACDVADARQHLAAFQAHVDRWGRLDYALLNAGAAGRRSNQGACGCRLQPPLAARACPHPHTTLPRRQASASEATWCGAAATPPGSRRWTWTCGR